MNQHYGRYGRSRGRDFAARAPPKKKGKNHIPERWKDYLPVGQRMPGTRFIAFKVPLQKKFEAKLMPEECFSPLDLFNKIQEQNEELGLIIDLTYTQRYYKVECRCRLGQKRAPDPLEQELQAVVSHQTWVLRTKLRLLEEQQALLSSDLPETISYIKILTVGHQIPDNNTIFQFKCAVKEFLKANKNNGFLCVALAVLELTLKLRLASNSEICLPLPPKCWDYRCAPPPPSSPYFSTYKLIGVHCTHGLNRTGYLICRYLIDVEGMRPDDAIELFNRCRGHCIERQNYIENLQKRRVRKEAFHFPRTGMLVDLSQVVLKTQQIFQNTSTPLTNLGRKDLRRTGVVVIWHLLSIFIPRPRAHRTHSENGHKIRVFTREAFLLLVQLERTVHKEDSSGA
ncbi:RNA/RNP complex-1-interacting phosphatase [Apodemus speciosus]|uniref:RNA/RNP complex-1-interacting phosphatase n=1 Tax=Apodemus speciosus TaxID=105296 RepID=A0ABQ0EVG4_APOSI